MAFNLFNVSTWFSKGEVAVEAPASEADFVAPANGMLENISAATAPVPMDALMAAPQTLPEPANDTPPDLVGDVNRVLKAALNKQKVDRHGSREMAGRPSYIMGVESVSLTGVSEKDVWMNDTVGNERVKLTISMRDHVGNYDIDSLNNAIHAVLATIPGLKGHVTFAKDIKEQALNHADIWKQLEPIVKQSGKFSQQDIGALAQYFTESAAAPAGWNDAESVKVDNKEDKVQIRLFSREVNGDEKVGISAQERVLGYFTQNRDAILNLMREKVMKLNNLAGAGITADDFKDLYFDINIKQAEGEYQAHPLLEFGTKKVDPQDPSKISIDTTKLAKIDTDKVQKIFVESLMEVSKELPYVFGRIADGPMVAKVLRDRIGSNPQLDKLLEYSMFEDRVSGDAKAREDVKQNIVRIGNAKEADEPHKLSLTFGLPHGMDLAQLRANVISLGQQTQTHVQALQASTDIAPQAAAARA